MQSMQKSNGRSPKQKSDQKFMLMMIIGACIFWGTIIGLLIWKFS